MLIKRLFPFLLLLILLSGCYVPVQPALEVTPTLTLTPFQAILATPTLTSTPTPIPTETPVPTATPESRAAAIPIIEYHSPNFNMNPQVQMQPAWFSEQLKWLADNGYTTLSADELAAFVNGERTFPERSIVLSFDLGTAQYSDYADLVIPQLRQHGFKAVFFILVNNSVVRDDCSHPENVFCWDDLRGWMNEGLISIGSHGMTHPDYATISADAIRQDMSQSKQILEEKFGQPVVVLAYPYDSAPAAAQTILPECGYILGIDGNNRPDMGATVNDPQRNNLPRLYPYSSPGVYPLLYAYKTTFSEAVSAAEK